MFLLGLLVPSLATAELVIKPGAITDFAAPLSPVLRKMAGDGRVSAFTEARATVAVPANFTPDRTWPVLVISATSDPGYNSSRMNLRWFAAPALAAGWVVIAADPPEPVAAAEDTNGLRYAMVVAAFARLSEEWPEVTRWPRAFGGISGGAKRSAWLAAVSAVEGYRPLGVFQAGCNQPVMVDALEAYHPNRARFLATPVWLSSGTSDPIAQPGAMQHVEADLKRAGFQRVRLERFPGRHEVFAAHVTQALHWFLEVAASGEKPAP